MKVLEIWKCRERNISRRIFPSRKPLAKYILLYILYTKILTEKFDELYLFTFEDLSLFKSNMD